MTCGFLIADQNSFFPSMVDPVIISAGSQHSSKVCKQGEIIHLSNLACNRRKSTLTSSILFTQWILFRLQWFQAVRLALIWKPSPQSCLKTPSFCATVFKCFLLWQSACLCWFGFFFFMTRKVSRKELELLSPAWSPRCCLTPVVRMCRWLLEVQQRCSKRTEGLSLCHPLLMSTSQVVFRCVWALRMVPCSP